ncbi:hypothetical protein [Pseudactinotalea sp. HY158]|nr:hypothetical protein [Pseudactinotalea sp. HY158]
MSRLGDYECWAIFEGTGVREVARDTIARDDAALDAVATLWGLNIF